MARRPKQDTCEVFCFNEEAVQQVKRQLLPLDKVFRLAETFKTMGDPTRISIIQSLSLQELCVCDLAAVLEMSQYSVR